MTSLLETYEGIIGRERKDWCNEQRNGKVGVMNSGMEK